MTISPIRPADLPKLAELYEELSGEPSSLEAMRESFAAMEGDPRYLIMGVHSDGELAGSAMGVVCGQLSRDARPFMVMENFVIAEKHRRKGLGRTLLAEMERLAVERNCRLIMFISSMKRKQAHAFYRSAGYNPDDVLGFKKVF